MTSMANSLVSSQAPATELTVSVEVEDAVRQHARLAYQVAYSALRNHDDAEDATQETFLRLLRYRGRLERAHEPRAFIARVAWRVALDRLRRRKRQAEVSLEDTSEIVRTMSAKGRSTEEIALSREMQLLLERLVASLPRKLRNVFRLSTVDGIRAREIASILNIPEASVRTRLFRARRLLREKVSSLVGIQTGRST